MTRKDSKSWYTLEKRYPLICVIKEDDKVKIRKDFVDIAIFHDFDEALEFAMATFPEYQPLDNPKL